MKCKECKYWMQLYEGPVGERKQVKDGFNDLIGWCKIHSPIVDTQFPHSPAWPRTAEDYFCGEFEPKLSEIEELKKSKELWRSNYWFANRRLREQAAKNRQFRAWLLRVALPLNGCKKSSTTARFQKVIECKLKEMTETSSAPRENSN